MIGRVRLGFDEADFLSACLLGMIFNGPYFPPMVSAMPHHGSVTADAVAW
jgi:hypothetical protein